MQIAISYELLNNLVCTKKCKYISLKVKFILYSLHNCLEESNNTVSVYNVGDTTVSGPPAS